MKIYHRIVFFILLATSCRSVQNIRDNKTDVTKQEPVVQAAFIDAEIARLSDKTDLALKRYEQFVREHPENATALFNLAQLQLKKLSFHAAERYAASACAIRPDNKFFREFYATILSINKKTKLALAQYDILLTINPDQEEYWYAKAITQLMVKEYEQALHSLSELEKRTGFNSELIEQKKAIYLKQGKTELAIREIQRLKAEDHSSSKYDLMIADIYENERQFEKADSIYNKVKIDFSDDPVALIALAQYYAEKGDTDVYHSYIRRIIQNPNLDVETKIGMVIPAIRKFDQDSSRQADLVDLTCLLREKSPLNKDAISLYANVLYISREFDKALKEYTSYLLLDKKRFEVWAQVLSIHAEQRNWSELIQASKECISLFPDKALPFYYTGIAFQQSKQDDSAIHFFTKGLVSEKNNQLKGQFLASLGESYNSLKRFRESDSAFNEAILLQPMDAGTLNNYAYYLSLRNERLEEAAQLSEKSLRLEPSSPSFLDTYGWILYQQGNYKEALLYLKRSHDAGGSKDATVLEHLGDVHLKLGEIREAAEYYEKALLIDTRSELLQQKLNDARAIR